MDKDQRGFTIIEVVLILVITCLLGATGWYVWNRSNEKNANTESSLVSTPQPETSQNNIAVEEVDIKIVTKQDLSTLPASAPAGFIEAFSAVVKENVEKTDEYGCSTIYLVKKISSLNVEAAAAWVEIKNGAIVEDSMICGGGARSIWAIVDSKWAQVVGGNAEIPCAAITSPKVYSEFAPECYDELTNKDIPNPNGSIQTSSL